MTTPLDTVSFAIRDDEVLELDASWVYVWRETTPARRIVRVGATWLHPAARAAKHLSDGPFPDADAVAFRVPPKVDRGRARDLLAQALTDLGLMARDVKIGAGSGAPRDDAAPTESDRAFVAQMLKVLM